MNEFENARASLVSDLRDYLVGPIEGENEQIPERASDRYHVGILWPSGTGISAEEDDIVDSADIGGGDSKTGDGVFALANASQQSAMGFTFQVRDGVPICIEASWADYVAVPKPEKHASADDERKETPESVLKASELKIVSPKLEGVINGDSASIGVDEKGKRKRKQQYLWQRQPYAVGPVDLPVLAPGSLGLQTLTSSKGIALMMLERRHAGVRVITLSLVSSRKRPPRKGKSDENVIPVDENIYQAHLKVYSKDGSEIFVARPSGQFVADPEYLVHELLYRNVRQFAVGHGCAVDWSTKREGGGCASEIHSEWIPATEVFKASSEVPQLKGHPMLDLKVLCENKREDTVACLRGLPEAYGQWIGSLAIDLESIVQTFEPALRERIRGAAADNLKKCREIQERMTEGIDLLVSDDLVFKAFLLANRAMAKSMTISRPSEPARWRPFQLAFLLLSIPSTAYGDHPARNTLDLIWFPTGGGKTEAYLGLVAFTLFFRRIASVTPARGGGTAVITRYTLRLLTMQQFERAARAVMACENLRQQDQKSFGEERFSIGLFVGNGATPGTIEDAATVIAGTNEDKALTTLPVSKCPWCGTTLVAGRDQVADTAARKVHTRCFNSSCDFRAGIPISCVDEELYEHPPSMVIGTVDKFAMMAWQPRIGRLFGAGLDAKPPTLIIQDELHLIGDALGSMTGLYETAIDLLCTDGGVQPKIIGSTATIRRAEQQIHSVFLREVAQFPPSGLNYDDSFFYREQRSNDTAGRLYLGVHAQGRSPKHTLARLMGILGQGANAIENPIVQDQFWTLVTYFNSLRELGGAWVLALDDVPKYVKAMPRKRKQPTRSLGNIMELTSHLPSTEIPLVLQNIARGKGSADLDREPVDLLLCTNMISVGVDIDRLGLMIVNGQPKTTAEYIQASSRVGRPDNGAGLVVTLYNWTRPRDRSHYERFRAYHESFYRNVEATSVTPFSARARDRALHGVLVALLRLSINQLASSPSAISDKQVQGAVQAIIESIVARARAVSESDPISIEVRDELEGILAEIGSVAKLNGVWSKRRHDPQAKARFMRRPNEAAGISGGYETPQSMRDVDPPCAVELKNIGRGRGEQA